jgi:carbamoyl-phosphate synthase large subunit
MTRILLTGAGGSAAYNFNDALSLAKRDYQVIGTDTRPYHLELIDVEKKYLVPPVSDAGYLDAMNRLIEKEKIDFVHPQPDVEVAFLASNTDKLNAKTFLPSADAVEKCHDKMEFNKILTSKGVAVPKAVHITDQQSLKDALDELLKVQPKVWLRAIRGAGSRGSLPINSFYQGDAWIDYWRNFRGIDYGDFMASEFLPGHEYAWQSLWYEGELITAQARERLEYIFGNLTPSGQTSSPSVAKTVNRDDINEIGQAAVRAVSDKPHGVFCVDMKEGADGVPKVTEINVGRFFTTSNFFAHAGLNMPDMYIQLGLTGQLNGDKPKRLNPLEDDLYWVRMIDMGVKLVKGDAWSSTKA